MGKNLDKDFDKKFDKKIKARLSNEKIEVPNSVHCKVDESLNALPEQMRKIHKPYFKPVMALASCALIFLVLLPNFSVAYGEVLSNVPILGDVANVFTVRNYFYADERHDLDIEVPNVVDKNNMAASQVINEDISRLTNELLSEFYGDIDKYNGEANSSLHVEYSAITNTEKIFTLKITVSAIAASGMDTFKYYHIDRANDKIIELKDLFKSNEYENVLVANIREQMKEQMAENPNIIYWIDENDSSNFKSIAADHNFYFNKDGNLVIPFDKYEVAPGAGGTPEFTIPKDVINNILKDEYKNIF